MSAEGDALGIAIANSISEKVAALLAATPGQPPDRIEVFKAMGNALLDDFAPNKLETLDKIVLPFGLIPDGTVFTRVGDQVVGEVLPTGLPPIGVAGGDLTGTYPSPTIATGAVTATKIASATITDVQVAAANKDGTSGTPSLRTLGTGAAQACAGNDSRLSDARAPTGSAGGDLAGTYPNPTLAPAGVGAGTYGGGSSYVNSITFDSKGRPTAVTTGVPAGTGSGIRSWFDKYVANAIANLALTAGQISVFDDDFASTTKLGWSSAGTAITNQIGGVIQVPGASAASKTPCTIANSTSTKWYIAARFCYPTSIVAGTSLLNIGLADSTNGKICEIGVDATNSTTKYIARFTDGIGQQYIQSTISIDTHFHDGELWYDGTNLNLSIDGETVVVAAPTHLVSNTFMFGHLVGDNAHGLVDKFLVVTGEPS